MDYDEEYKSLSDLVKGRRIVDIGYMLSQYEKVATHRFHCTMGHMKFVKETRKGLKVTLHFFCDNCERKMIVTSERDSASNDDINKAAVWGSMAIGIGHSQCEEFLGVLDVPFMTQNTYFRKTSEVKKVQ